MEYGAHAKETQPYLVRTFADFHLVVSLEPGLDDGWAL